MNVVVRSITSLDRALKIQLKLLSTFESLATHIIITFYYPLPSIKQYVRFICYPMGQNEKNGG